MGVSLCCSCFHVPQSFLPYLHRGVQPRGHTVSEGLCAPCSPKAFRIGFKILLTKLSGFSRLPFPVTKRGSDGLLSSTKKCSRSVNWGEIENTRGLSDFVDVINSGKFGWLRPMRSKVSLRSSNLLGPTNSFISVLKAENTGSKVVCQGQPIFVLNCAAASEFKF
jgi:hypothetical protein